MTYVHDRKKDGKKVNLDKGFGISKEDKKRAVAKDYVIDVNLRKVKDTVNNDEPRMKE
jgi:hypothetical protein